MFSFSMQKWPPARIISIMSALWSVAVKKHKQWRVMNMVTGVRISLHCLSMTSALLIYLINNHGVSLKRKILVNKQQCCFQETRATCNSRIQFSAYCRFPVPPAKPQNFCTSVVWGQPFSQLFPPSISSKCHQTQPSTLVGEIKPSS